MKPHILNFASHRVIHPQKISCPWSKYRPIEIRLLESRPEARHYKETCHVQPTYWPVGRNDFFLLNQCFGHEPLGVVYYEKDQGQS